MESIHVLTRSLMVSETRVSLLLYLLICTSYAFSTACANSEQSGKSGQRVAETAAAAPSQAPSTATTPNESAAQPTPGESLTLPPPKPEEVHEVVARVYKDTVAIDMSHQPSAIVGDFNGDGSQDIAVVVRPAKDKLEELNSEVANWVVEDPRQVVLPDPHKTVQKLLPTNGPVRVQPGDLLLTIIHGYKETGWRNPEAQQSYLLSNAVGASMAAASLKALQSATGNNRPSNSGDVITETLAGEHGFLYWTGAKYAWRKKQG
jgi:hypothetical protein